MSTHKKLDRANSLNETNPRIRNSLLLSSTKSAELNRSLTSLQDPNRNSPNSPELFPLSENSSINSNAPEDPLIPRKSSLTISSPATSQRDNKKIITINVGGTLFTTFASTLSSANHLVAPQSFLACLFRFENVQDSEGRIFIDRNPSVFKSILEYLRTGNVSELTKYNDQTQMFTELDYFGIEVMIPSPILHWKKETGVQYCVLVQHQTSHELSLLLQTNYMPVLSVLTKESFHQAIWRLKFKIGNYITCIGVCFGGFKPTSDPNNYQRGAPPAWGITPEGFAVTTTSSDIRPYGLYYKRDDVVELTLDCDNHRISFQCDGIDYGFAFANLPQASFHVFFSCKPHSTTLIQQIAEPSGNLLLK